MFICAESLPLVSGLHSESLQQAEKQVALMCDLLTDVEVPLTLSMLQVAIFCSTFLCFPGSMPVLAHKQRRMPDLLKLTFTADCTEA